MKIFRFFGCVCEPWTLRWLVLSEQASKTKNIKLALHTNRRNAHVWETGTVISDTSRHAGDLTQSCKSVSQVVLVNETVSVLIHYGKSLQKYYCYTLWFQYAQSDIHHRQNCWQSKKKEKTFGPSTDFFELLDLGLFKHGEHVGAGSVSSPLLGFLGGLQGFWQWHSNQIKY